MKKVFLFFALLLSGLTAGAQDIELTPDGAYERKEVVTVDSASAAVLYDRAMMALSDWAGPDGKAKAGIDYQSQETHTVVYKGSFYAGARKWMMTQIDRHANFTVKVRCKDGRAQVTVNVSTLTATVASNGRTRTASLAEVIGEMKKTSGARRERGEDAMAYITNTADNLFNAMKLRLQGHSGSTDGGDDDF